MKLVASVRARLGAGRFDQAYGNALGSYMPQGRGFTFVPRAYYPAKQQRWRIVQRELRNDLMVDVSYNGAHSWIAVTQNIAGLL